MCSLRGLQMQPRTERWKQCIYMSKETMLSNLRAYSNGLLLSSLKTANKYDDGYQMRQIRSNQGVCKDRT